MKLLLLFIALTLQAYAKSEAGECKPVIAVYPWWKHDQQTMEKLPWDRFTHLAIFAAHPTDSAQLNSSNIDSFITELTEAAHNKGKQVILSIGGAGEASKAFLKVSSHPSLKITFAENIADYVKKYELDGVDIDWEYWTYQSELGKGGNDPVESKNLVSLLADLRKALPENTLLTADIFAGSWVGPQYLPEIQDYVDYVNLMAYDFTGEWPESPIGHHSDFETFKKAINDSLNSGFRPDKLLIGLPAYGKEFVDGKTRQVRDVAYADIVNTLNGKELLIAKGNHNNLYFETRSNIEDKINYINDRNFAGIFLFEVTSDHPDEKFSLLHSASTALNPGRCYN